MSEKIALSDKQLTIKEQWKIQDKINQNSFRIGAFAFPATPLVTSKENEFFQRHVRKKKK